MPYRLGCPSWNTPAWRGGFHPAGRRSVRFIGGPDLGANQPWLLPWVERVAGWIERGLAPYVFLHTPDNHLAAEQALRFHALLRGRLPGLPELHAPAADAPQPALF
ncbi:hypothetical protein ASF01_10465 [Stenotrophomonas sp. Leaf70]|uniref:DUF72 domain-containing protein n=1 Tax=Stenotrophomonas sp. Leaf70 TaxID=1736233 RepID=UPI0006F309F0|nr:DUF72 domain-containing protein [Stenotrophomonas sp. Leaf70]KQN98264.1 hypothetical protein ASF01_10465 [Stenotrophomonas sp. Leaf70]